MQTITDYFTASFMSALSTVLEVSMCVGGEIKEYLEAVAWQAK
jgi:hypothetical protein